MIFFTGLITLNLVGTILSIFLNKVFFLQLEWILEYHELGYFFSCLLLFDHELGYFIFFKWFVTHHFSSFYTVAKKRCTFSHLLKNSFWQTLFHKDLEHSKFARYNICSIVPLSSMYLRINEFHVLRLCFKF